MSSWSRINFQEGMSVIMELLNYFHDYMMMIFIFIMVFVMYLFVFVSLKPKLDHYFLDSHVLETIWTVIPMGILLLMAFPSLYLLYLMEEVYHPSLSVKVIGHQWYWEYQIMSLSKVLGFDSYMVYESSNKFSLFYNLDVDNRLILPTLSHILFLITSVDVLHSWTVPSLGIKVDACPGRLNYLTSLVSLVGIYYGQCSEICGANHSFMPIVVEFVPMKTFLSVVNHV